jgi:hypothetical protein
VAVILARAALPKRSPQMPVAPTSEARREVLRKALFVAPAILSLPAVPSFASAGSSGDDGDEKDTAEKDKAEKDKAEVDTPGEIKDR